MVQSCCAYNCTNRAKAKVEGEERVSFHSFPKDKALLKKWIIAIKRDKWVPTNSSRICSQHFSPDSYETSGWSNMPRLKPDAVPNRFQFPQHLQKIETPVRKSPVKRKQNTQIDSDFSPSDDENSAQIENMTIPNKVRLCYLGDFTKHDVEVTAQNFSLYSNLVEKTLEKKNKQIKLLKQQNCRLSKRLTTLESMVTELLEKNLAAN